MSFFETLLLPFRFDFMINAMAIAVMVAVPMALLSCFLVLKGWSLMGDAISHAVFPGVVIAVVIGAATSFFGAYASYFLDGATGGIIVVLQTVIFLLAFFLAPKHGMIATRRRAARDAGAGA